MLVNEKQNPRRNNNYYHVVIVGSKWKRVLDKSRIVYIYGVLCGMYLVYIYTLVYIYISYYWRMLEQLARADTFVAYV